MEEKKKKLTYDDYIYYSFLITIIFFFIIIILYKYHFYKYINIPLCVFYSNFKIYCPACGMTRASIALMNGEFLKTTYYNPTVTYMTIYVIIYMISGTISKLLKKDFIMKYNVIHIYIGIAILLINCIIKNIMLLGYGIEM